MHPHKGIVSKTTYFHGRKSNSSENIAVTKQGLDHSVALDFQRGWDFWRGGVSLLDNKVMVLKKHYVTLNLSRKNIHYRMVISTQ